MKQLGHLGPNAENAVPYLIQLLHNEKNTNVLSHIEDALWAIGPGRATHNLADAMLNRKELREMISAPNVYTRLYAAFALGYRLPISDPKEVVRALISATKDQDDLVRWMAVKGLGRLGPIARDAVPALIEILRADNHGITSQTMISLAGIGPDAVEAVPVLLDHLYQDDFQLSTVAALSLARIGPVTLPLLKQELKSHPFNILEVLDHMGPAGAPVVIDALSIPNKDVRKKALRVIQTFGEAAEPAVPLLVNALRDPDVEMRQEAAWALIPLGPLAQSAVPPLMTAMSDKDETGRCSAMNALGAIGPAAKPAAPKLLQRMKSTTRPRNEYLQRCAAGAPMKMSPETRALVPASMIKEVEEWDAMIRSTLPSGRFTITDPTKPNPKRRRPRALEATSNYFQTPR